MGLFCKVLSHTRITGPCMLNKDLKFFLHKNQKLFLERHKTKPHTKFYI
jgi:hypothetical protein